MKRLDKTRPYGEIHGGARVQYFQDEIIYDDRFHEVKEVVVPPDPKPPPPPIDLSKLPIVQLKELVEEHGGSYDNKQHAIEFLESKIK